MSLLGNMKKMLGSKPKSGPVKTAVKKTVKPMKKPRAKKAIVKKRNAAPLTKKVASKTGKKSSTPKKTSVKKTTPAVKAKSTKQTTSRKTARTKSKLSQKTKSTKKTPAQRKSRKQTDIDYVQQFRQPEPAPVVEKKIIKYPVLQGGDSERIKMLLPILRELVKKGQLSDWIINLNYTKATNLYAQKNLEIEDELSSVREDIILTIYERFENGMMGEARIPIITLDATEAKAQILDAKTACVSAQKPQFDLPEPQEGIEQPRGHDEKLLAQIFDGNGVQTPRAIHAQARTIMQSLPDVKMNCCEIHANATTVRVVSSTGVDICFHKTGIYLEAVLTCKVAKPDKTGEKASEREFLFSRTAVSPEQLDIQGIILQQAQIARDATAAEPNQGFTGDVLLSGSSVTEFFAPHHDLNPLVLHTFAKLHHMGLSSFKIGQPIGQFTSGEPITIATNPSLPLGLYTMPVDEEGTPLSTVELVRNGLFVSYLAGARYAHYLGVPLTGNITNVHVNPGATREEHLRGNNYVEIVSFSWFNPNPLSGDFSAEIRLAYRWVNGRKTPIRGGTFTGNVFTNILAARFSKEIMQSGAYYGPRAVLFKNAIVTKFE